MWVCSMCPSRDPCLKYALDENVGHGIWGGLTEAGRRSAKRNQSAKRKVASRNRPPEEQPRPADGHRMVV